MARKRKTHDCDTEKKQRLVVNNRWTWVYSCTICGVEQYRVNDTSGVVVNPPTEEEEEEEGE
jgi:predicted enzyme related to lactoylglutathione lyase